MWGSDSLRHAAWLLLFCSAAVAAAIKPVADADVYHFAPAPAWVETARPDYNAPSPPGELSDGSWFLMLDRQIDIQSRGDEDYTHVAIKVVNAEGVDRQSQIDFNVDPHREFLSIHALRVMRDGTPIDQRGTARITVLPQEPELEKHIYNGSYKVNVVLSDVRVGDVVEYEYTIRAHDWLMPGNFARRIAVSWADPMNWQRVRLRYPDARPLRYRFSGGAVPPEERHTGGYSELVFQWTGLPAMAEDKDHPSWLLPWSTLDVSDLPDWAAVMRQLNPLFIMPNRERPRLEAALAKLKEGPGDREELAMRALRFVQENIRYTSISIGRNSYTPTDPETVLERGFGDCKDKSLLLATLLQRMGIDARPALVNSRRGPILPQYLPSPYAFDHAIVRARIGDAIYWLDGTNYAQYSPLKELPPADYFWALPIATDTKSLESIPRPAPASSGREVRIDFDLSNGLHQPAAVKVVTRYAGDSADDMRNSLKRQSNTERQANYLNYYARFYPGIKVAAPISISDDTASNVLTTHEQYTLEKTFTPKDKEREGFSIHTDELYHYAERLKSSVRTSPLAVDYPAHVRQVVVVHMPDDWKFNDEVTTIDDPAFRYRSEISHDGRVVTLDYDYEALADHVDVANLPRYQEDRSKLDNDLDYNFSQNLGTQKKERAPLAIAPLPLFAALLSLGLGTWLMRRFVYRYDPPPRAASLGAPQGISGWLVLPALRCLFSPLGLLVIVGEFSRFAAADMWQTLPTIVKAQFADWAQPVLVLQLVIGGLLLPFSITVSLLFFRKRTSVPLLFVVLLAAALGYSGLVIATAAIGGIKGLDQDLPKSVTQVISGVAGLILWSAYMLRSSRVKATFVNRLAGAPSTVEQSAPLDAA